MKTENKVPTWLGMRWLVGTAALTGCVFCVVLLGTHVMWQSGLDGKAQTLFSLTMMAILPFTLAVILGVSAWLSCGARRRMLLSGCLGCAVAGAVMTGILLAKENRRTAVTNLFVDNTATYGNDEDHPHR